MITAIIVGAGHRALCYAKYARKCPDKLKIVGIADPNKMRREQTKKEFGFSDENCFESAEKLAEKEKFADAIINGTMDHQHVPTSIPLLEKGYDILLEKPIAISNEELDDFATVVKNTGRKVMICHVLRYVPFYVKMKEYVMSGKLGKIFNIQTAEHVSYHHMANCFIRGKWNRKDAGGSSILMAKCCHDLDLITWFMSGVAPLKVTSFGGLHYFNRENAPKDSGEYCLLDCPIEEKCLYSNRKINLDHPNRWSFYVWADYEHLGETTLSQKESFLKDKSNPYSKCVWKSDNDVADRQSVMIEFADGTTATHNLVCGTSRAMRKIHIIGSEGELQGILDDNKFVIRHFDTRPEHEYIETEHDLNFEGDMSGAFGGHGGGDLRLVADFVSVLSGNKPSISCTSLNDSLNGHKIGFYADKSMAENSIETIFK